MSQLLQYFLNFKWVCRCSYHTARKINPKMTMWCKHRSEKMTFTWRLLFQPVTSRCFLAQQWEFPVLDNSRSGRPRSALHLGGGGSRRRKRNTCVTSTLTWQGLLEVTLLDYTGVGLSFKFRMREMQRPSDVPKREFEEHYLAAPWYSQLI